MDFKSMYSGPVMAWVHRRLQAMGPTNITRVWPWWIATLALLAIVSRLSPGSLGVLTLKVGQQLLAAILGYHLAKITLIHAVPVRLREIPMVSAALTLGRAIVMAGAMLAVGLGL